MSNYIFLGLAVLSGNLSAQNFYNTPGTVVSISPGGTMSVTDILINNGTLINNGNLVVGGSWENLGSYDAGNGQITFNSTDTSVPQVINHNNQSFNKLVISGGGLKQILADLTVEESLTLTDGIITAQNGSKVHFSSTSVISGGSNAAHINAPVYQQGTGTKLFPVGNGTLYLPVRISGIAANSEIGITLTELQNGETLHTNASLSSISNKRYWTVDVTTGSLNGASIILPLVGDEGLDVGVSERLVVAFADSKDDNFMSLGRGLGSTSAIVESAQSPAMGVVTLGILSENQSIVVFNAISSNPNDALNSYIRIDNLVEDDVVSIYNRWGDLVFEMKNYDNDDVAKRFNGQSNVGGTNDLPAGNYFYVIRRKAGKEVSGFLSLRK